MSTPSKTRRRLLVGLLMLLALGGGIVTAWWWHPAAPPPPSQADAPLKGALALIAADHRKAPKDFPFTTADGTPMTLAGFKGKVVLVNLWATWCPPCVAEMPDLDRLNSLLGGADFQVAAISLDRGGKAIVEKWNAQAGIRSLAIHNANPADFPGAVLPTSILLDRQGRVAWTGAGIYAWAEDDALAMIKAAIAE